MNFNFTTVICPLKKHMRIHTHTHTGRINFFLAVHKGFANYIPYLNPLQSRGGLCDSLWHIKAFGSADFGIDQPLLEVSKGCTKPLLQQALLILTFPGCTKTQTAGKKKKRKKRPHLSCCSWVEISREKWTKKERSYKQRKCLLPMCPSKQRRHVLMLWYCPDCTHVMEDEPGMRNGQVEKWQSGWSGRNERWGKEGERVDGAKGHCVGGGLRGNIWLGQEFTWVTRWRERGTTAWCYKKEMRWRRYVRKRSQRGLTEYQRYTFKFGF